MSLDWVPIRSREDWPREHELVLVAWVARPPSRLVPWIFKLGRRIGGFVFFQDDERAREVSACAAFARLAPPDSQKPSKKKTTKKPRNVT